MITKQEKRATFALKQKNKQKNGGTLAGQMTHMQTTKKYAGRVKKIK